MNRSGRLFLFTSMTLLLLIGSLTDLKAADPNQAHPHQGILPPYNIEALSFPLNEKQEKKLTRGGLVISTIQNADWGGRGIAVLDIKAPADIVWSRIRGFNNYVEWINPVKIAEIYGRDQNHTYCYVKLSGFLYNYEYYLKNSWWPEQNLLTWVQDYDRYSDFDDCVGAWYVEPHPYKQGWSRAWFSNDIKLRARIPEFLMDFVKKQGLRDATSWVRKESEKAANSLENRNDF
jgi:hypothetical protein